jgi:hypothetical protein
MVALCPSVADWAASRFASPPSAVGVMLVSPILSTLPLSTVKLTDALVVLCPAISLAVAVSVWLPLATVVESSVVAYGLETSSGLRLFPSILNWTPTTPVSSLALADTATELPLTVVPAVGAVRLTVGGVTSDAITQLSPVPVGTQVSLISSIRSTKTLSSLPDKDEDGFSGACIKSSPCGGGTLYPQTAGWLNTYHPDLVIMQGGENDFSDPSLTEQQDATNMENWIQLVWQTLPNAKIIVSGAPWHGTYDSLVHTYCSNLQAQGKPIRWVPYDDRISRIDGTHPDAAGYITWANELAPMVRELYP